MVEHMLSTQEVLGSIPGIASKNKQVNLVTSPCQKIKIKKKKCGI